MANIDSKLHQINNALNSALASINLAKNLIRDIESAAKTSLSTKSIPGFFGKFVGDGMMTEDGQKLEVPQNYASKSMLVYGDKLKMYEENGQKRFKQVERVKRLRMDGILAKKEGRWHAVTSDGSYRVLDVSVEHFNGVEGDQVVVLLPESDKYAPYATVESIAGKTFEQKKPASDEPQKLPPVVDSVNDNKPENVPPVLIPSEPKPHTPVEVVPQTSTSTEPKNTTPKVVIKEFRPRSREGDKKGKANHKTSQPVVPRNPGTGAPKPFEHVVKTPPDNKISPPSENIGEMTDEDLR